MAPNLFLAVKTAFQPHSWFKHREGCQTAALALTQFRNDPVPGIYEHIPGCGWFLIAKKPSESSPASTATAVSPAEPVVYSKVLKRFLFEQEFVSRTRQAPIQGQPKWVGSTGFFMLDDGITWVNCWEHDGHFKKGPWVRYCWDANQENFRTMLVGDVRHDPNDPEWAARRASKSRKQSTTSNRTASRAGSLDVKGDLYSTNSSRSNSTCGSFVEDTKNHSRRASRIVEDGSGNLRVESVSSCSRSVSPNPKLPRSSLRGQIDELDPHNNSDTQLSTPEQKSRTSSRNRLIEPALTE